MKNEVNSLSETRVGKTVWKEKLRKWNGKQFSWRTDGFDELKS
jgi:hypothetical protein